jgi:hypothetical protein
MIAELPADGENRFGIEAVGQDIFAKLTESEVRVPAGFPRFKSRFYVLPQQVSANGGNIGVKTIFGGGIADGLPDQHFFSSILIAVQAVVIFVVAAV